MFIQPWNHSIQFDNKRKQYRTICLETIKNMTYEGPFVSKNHTFENLGKSFKDLHNGREKYIIESYKNFPYIEIPSMNTIPIGYYKDGYHTSYIVPPNYTFPLNDFNLETNVLKSVGNVGSNSVQYIVPSLNITTDDTNKDNDKAIPRDIHELIYALQTGGSRCKMEAAITVRSLATSNNLLQTLLIEAGGIDPLVNLLKYKAGEVHWPIELKEKATITVRAEAALALASLSVSNDQNRDIIGAAGAIPLLCDLIQFYENNHNTTMTKNYHIQEMAPFYILARDASVGALSCLSKSENNKDAIISANILPLLVCIVDQGSSFSRAAAANVIAKLAIGEHATHNRLMLGHESKAIPALIRLLEQGSSKAKETAADALKNLAIHEWNRSTIIQHGGVECLMQLLKVGNPLEKEAATAALKVVKANDLGGLSIADLLQKSSIGGQCNGTDDNVDGLYQSSVAIASATIEKIQDCENLCGEKPDNEASIELRKELDGLAKHDIQESIQVNDSSKVQNDTPIWQKHLTNLKLYLPKLQNVSMSELTSTLAPPLTGQPSKQADAIIDNSKGSSPSNPSNKRMKMSIPEAMDFRISQTEHTRLLGESKDQKVLQKNPTESMQMRMIDSHKENVNISWDKSGEVSHQKNHCLPTSGGYGVSDSIRQQQSRQSIVVDNQLVAGGIGALVGALSSSNPSAQEFAALALMLLASQGGFDVKTTISDAGAIPLLITMVDSSTYPMIRESAAAAIAKLVSYHPINRARVVKVGGIKAMVNMARWSTTLTDDSSSPDLQARIQAAAIVAVLNIGNIQDKQNTSLGLRDAMPIVVNMLESDNFNELQASVGGLQAITTSLGSVMLPPGVKKIQEQNSSISLDNGFVAIEMITVLLHLARGSSTYAKQAALEALIELRKETAPFGRIITESERGATQHELNTVQQQNECTRRDSIHALSILLAKCPTSAKESVTAAFASVVASDKLSVYLTNEAAIIHQLMMILEDGPTLATKVSAAASIATIGARNKKLDALTREHILLILQLLTANEFENGEWEAPSVADNPSGIYSMPLLLLREHITAIIVYTALSGDVMKQLLISTGVAPILVLVLKGCLSNTPNNSLQGSWQYLQSMSKNRTGITGVPPYLHATQEFATMALIMLADKSIETMEKIVDAGGIALLVKMLTATLGCRGKLGANWSEMAAAALLTLAGCDKAREEIVRVGGIASLVQVLKGEGGAVGFSLTGLAAMAQLLGVLALNSEETKVHMADEGAVTCLVEILIGGSRCCTRSQVDANDEQNSSFVALAHEAAAAALATVILHCVGNAESAAKAGAIGPLVNLLGPLSLDSKNFGSAEPADLLPSAYKYVRSRIRFPGIATATNVDDTLIQERGDSKMTSVADEDAERTGVRAGGPLAAMAALGNMVSCFPQCWREIVDAGAAPRLANLLQGGPWTNSEVEGGSSAPTEDVVCCPSKVQESAALVLDLLIQSEESTGGVPEQCKPSS